MEGSGNGGDGWIGGSSAAIMKGISEEGAVEGVIIEVQRPTPALQPFSLKVPKYVMKMHL